MRAAFEVLRWLLDGVITVVVLAGLAAMLYVIFSAAPVFVSLIRFFCGLVVGQVKRAWRADLNLWRTFKRWLRGHIVVQVLAVEPGDIVLVNFGPGTVVDATALMEARSSIERAIHFALGPRGRGVQVITGKGIDVSVVRQVGEHRQVAPRITS